jgi:hypothetical protein
VSQPLATIRTYAEAGYRWLNRPDPNVAKGRDLMQRIVNNADRANDVISRIRAIAAHWWSSYATLRSMVTIRLRRRPSWRIPIGGGKTSRRRRT